MKTAKESAYIDLNSRDFQFLEACFSFFPFHITSLWFASRMSEYMHHHHKTHIQLCHQAISVSVDDDVKKKLTRDLSEYYAQYGHFLYQNHDYAAAKKAYSSSIKYNPGHSYAQNQMGMCLMREGLYEQACMYFTASLQHSYTTLDKAHAWANISFSYRKQNNHTQASYSLLQASQLAPHDVDVLKEVAAFMHWVTPEPSSSGQSFFSTQILKVPDVPIDSSERYRNR